MPETFAVLILATLVFAPLAIGGLQFALFQGNIYDQFNYLSSAVVRINETHASISAAVQEDFLRNPLLSVASIMREARPAVVDLFATFEALAPGNLHRSTYGFLASGVIVTFFATSEWIRILTQARVWRAQVVAAAFVAGFWGQLYFDLNAWSWSLAAAVVATAFGLLLSFFHGSISTAASPTPHPICDRRVHALGLCGGALTYLYPEILTFFLPAVAGGVAVVLSVRPQIRHIGRPLLWTVFIAFAIALPNLRICLELVFAQLLVTTSIDHSALDWFWQAITGGALDDVSILGSWMRWLVGAVGLAWLPGGPFTTALALAVVVLAAVGLHGRARTSPSIQYAALVGVLLGAQVAVLVALGHPWVGAKGLSYAAAVLLPLALLPTVGAFKAASAPAWLLLGLQLVCSGTRILGAADPSGIHNRDPLYPAVTDPVLKSVRGWSVGVLAEDLLPFDGMKVDIPDLWLETYATICAQSLGSRFSKALPVYTYWGFGDQNYGRQPPLRNYDALAYLEYAPADGHAALAFARTDGRIISSRYTPILQIEADAPLDTSNGRLAWTATAISGANAKTRLTIRAAHDGNHALTFGILADESARGRAEITVQRAAGAKINVLGHGLRVIQMVNTNIRLAEGENTVDISLRATTAEAVSITILGPLVMPLPH